MTSSAPTKRIMRGRGVEEPRRGVPACWWCYGFIKRYRKVTIWLRWQALAGLGVWFGRILAKQSAGLFCLPTLLATFTLLFLLLTIQVPALTKRIAEPVRVRRFFGARGGT